MKEVFSVGEIAKILESARSTIIYWIKDGRMKATFTPGGDHRIKRQDLQKFMKKYHYSLQTLDEYLKTRIVIVDDDLEVLRVLKLSLRTNENNIVQAFMNWFEGGFIAREWRPHFLILDIKLKQDDGRDICKQIRKNKDLEHTIIIGISGVVNMSEKECKKIGFDAFLRKPIDLKELNETIEMLRPRWRKFSTKYV